MILSLREAQEGEPLQLVLGTDKRNPLVSVYQSEDAETLHVYYGLELMEVIPDQREHLSYKLLVARLYNAGVKARTLQEVFDVDRKTMKRWGEALREGDPEKLIAVLAGRSRGKKITPEIEGFVRARFDSIYREYPRSYSAAIRKEIEEIFAVNLSGEALRPLFGQLREKPGHRSPKTDQASPFTSEPKQATTCARDPEDTSPLGEIPGDTPRPGQLSNGFPTLAEEESAELIPADHKQSPDFVLVAEGDCRFCHHAGVLIFSQALRALRESLPVEDAPLLQQWLAAVLLGALNIEQSKFLDLDDLELLLGRVIRQPHPQRLRLGEIAQSGMTEKLLALNFSQSQTQTKTECEGHGDFYYDPHTKHYTGEANILKGWCANRRIADKAMHTDFLHATDGTPVYMEWTDNYNTLPERFLPVIARFRSVASLAEDAPITITIDRGINNIDLFEQITAQKNLNIITWETGYKPEPWPPQLPVQNIKLQRSRNRASDLKSYHFEYTERPWRRNCSMRQILVKATNPSGRTIEVSILTDHPDRPASQVIRLIFWRWLQENDFKYLDKHFGINQITSYASIDYKALAETLEDKQMRNGQYQALVKQRLGFKRELGRLLTAQRRYRAQARQTNSRRKLPESAHETESKRQQRIAEIDRLIDELNTRIKDTQKEVSRLETLVEQKKKRLDTANKSVMDAVKVLARNAFYRTLLPFKHAYDNYRDDHDYFRKLTRSHGILIGRADHLEVQLISPVNFPPKIRRIIEEFLEQLNAANLELPDGSGRKIRLLLGCKAGIHLAPD